MTKYPKSRRIWVCLGPQRYFMNNQVDFSPYIFLLHRLFC
eukprot:UN04890